MRSTALRLMGVALAVLTAASPGFAARPRGSDAGFRRLILDRITAYGRGDVVAYTRLIDADFVHVSDLGTRRTRAEIPAYVAAHGDYHATYAIVRLTWKIAGQVAIVDAELREHLPDHDGGIMETDLFVWRGNRWRYRHHAETEIVQPLRPVAVAAAMLADYVGRYRTATGITDVITARDGRLFDATPPDPGATELTPVGRDAFAISGDPTLLVFVRDASGAVIQCLWHLPSGQLVTSTRVADAGPAPEG